MAIKSICIASSTSYLTGGKEQKHQSELITALSSVSTILGDRPRRKYGRINWGLERNLGSLNSAIRGHIKRENMPSFRMHEGGDRIMTAYSAKSRLRRAARRILFARRRKFNYSPRRPQSTIYVASRCSRSPVFRLFRVRTAAAAAAFTTSI